MGEERFYTVEEADALLADLRSRLDRIREARRTVLRFAKPVRARSGTNGGGTDGNELYEALRELRADIEELSARAIVLRDADSGLIDFPSRRDGRLVYLCWTPEEDRVRYWHEVDTGFSGRKPL